MKNRSVRIGALAGVLVVVLWWFFVYSGLNAKSSDVSDDIQAATTEQVSLRSQLAELEAIEAQAPQIETQLAELQEKLPANPDLAPFLDIATQIERDSEVSFVSIAPGDPTQSGAVATTPLSIVVEGGYFEVLEYLRLLEELPRLVVVDGINVAAGTETGADAGSAPSLQVTLTARMFSLNALTAPPTTATTTTVAGS